MDSTWILEGFLKPSAAHDVHSSGMIPREAKVRVETSTPFSSGGEGEREPLGDAVGDDVECDLDGPASEDAGEDIVDRISK